MNLLLPEQRGILSRPTFAGRVSPGIAERHTWQRSLQCPARHVDRRVSSTGVEDSWTPYSACVAIYRVSTLFLATVGKIADRSARCESANLCVW